MNPIKDYSKVCKTIDSCKDKYHLKGSFNLITNFNQKHKNDYMCLKLMKRFYEKELGLL